MQTKVSPLCAAATAATAKYWIGIVLQRNPVILPDPTPEEAAYEEFRLQMDIEKSKPLNPGVRREIGICAPYSHVGAST